MGAANGPEESGNTVNAAVLVTPLYTAEMVAAVDALTGAVLTANVALVAPAVTVTLAGTLATAGLLLDSETTVPACGATLDRLITPCTLEPPVTLAGLSARLCRLAGGGGGAGGVTVTFAVLVAPL